MESSHVECVSDDQQMGGEGRKRKRDFLIVSAQSLTGPCRRILNQLEGSQDGLVAGCK